MQRNAEFSSYDAKEDERILIASMDAGIDFSNPDERANRSLCVQNSENTARFINLNLTGWGLEYLVCDAGIMVANPQLYQNMWRVASDYYISPMALIGRGLIWADKSVLAVAYTEERPENLKEIAKTVACDLAALGIISLVYWAGSNSSKHIQPLVEIAFVDTFVVSATSLVIRAGASKIAECTSNIHWKFWQKRTSPHSILLDNLPAFNGNEDNHQNLLASDRKEESPPTPVFPRINTRVLMPSAGNSSRNLDSDVGSRVRP